MSAPRREYLEIRMGSKIPLWRNFGKPPKPWWRRLLEALDRAFWP